MFYMLTCYSLLYYRVMWVYWTFFKTCNFNVNFIEDVVQDGLCHGQSNMHLIYGLHNAEFAHLSKCDQ